MTDVRRVADMEGADAGDEDAGDVAMRLARERVDAALGGADEEGALRDEAEARRAARGVEVEGARNPEVDRNVVPGPRMGTPRGILRNASAFANPPWEYRPDERPPAVDNNGPLFEILESCMPVAKPRSWFYPTIEVLLDGRTLSVCFQP